MKYKLAIFDMDGTILDTIEDLCDSTNYILEKHNMPTRTLAEVKSFVGNGIRRLLVKAVPCGTDDAKIDEMFAEFNAYYKDHSAIKTRPYDKIADVIRELRSRGVLTAVVSNKPDFAVKNLCVDYFDGLFDVAIGENEKAGIKKKPARDMVDLCLSKLGMKREDAVYIGDSEVDLETAKNSEMDVIMVSWGFREKEMILSLKAPFVIDDPYEIIDRMS